MKTLVEHYTLSAIDGPAQVRALRHLYPEATILEQDVYNTIQKIKRERCLHGNDAASLLTKLFALKESNPDWFVSPLMDQDSGRLLGIFFMSPEQKALWIRFSDIISNDNTASTNAFNLPLSLFVAVDNHYHSRVVAQCVLPDETSTSYGWMLEQTIAATGVAPQAFTVALKSICNVCTP
jgi:hypothetical protein